MNPLTNDTTAPHISFDATTVQLLDPADSTYKSSVTIPGEGTYTAHTDGTVTFTPVAAFTGTATPVGYRVADTSGQSATSTITITVTPVTPVATDDTDTTAYETPVTVGVLGNDAGGDVAVPLDVTTVVLLDPADASYKTSVTIPGEGTYAVQSDGTVTFTPATGFFGPATPVGYQVADTNGTTATATITITVNDPGMPSASNDTDTTPQGVPVTVDPLTNDTADASFPLDATTVKLWDPADSTYKSSVTIPGEGTYTVHTDGTVTFAPEALFTGITTPVTYQVADTLNRPVTATITITVTPVTPAATDDTDTTPYETPVNVNILGNDTAGDVAVPLDPTTVVLLDPADSTYKTSVTIPGEGTYAVQSDGTVDFHPRQRVLRSGNTGRLPGCGHQRLHRDRHDHGHRG